MGSSKNVNEEAFLHVPGACHFPLLLPFALLDTAAKAAAC